MRVTQLFDKSQQKFVMDRKQFFATSVKRAAGCCALALFDGAAHALAAEQTAADFERNFVKNWMEGIARRR